MGEVRFFSTAALKAIVTRLGILVVLLLPPPHVVHGQQRPSISALLRQFEGEPVFWRQFEVANRLCLDMFLANVSLLFNENSLDENSLDFHVDGI